MDIIRLAYTKLYYDGNRLASCFALNIFTYLFITQHSRAHMLDDGTYLLHNITIIKLILYESVKVLCICVLCMLGGIEHTQTP